MSVKPTDDRFVERLAASGLRFTTQREHVYKVLTQHRDHPTAEQVFLRAKRSSADISLATIYNCLDALVKCGLVKEVNLDRGASRYCPNMREHYHFYCSQCEEVFDIELPTEGDRPALGLPSGFEPSQYDIAVRGLCPDCRAGRSPNG